MNKFSVQRADRSDRSHGGVIMYVDNKYNSISVTQTSNSQCELIGVLIKELKSLIFTVYRPPMSGNKDTFEETLEIISDVINKYGSELDKITV